VVFVPSKLFDASLAHPVEHRTFNPQVVGSRPTRRTSKSPGQRGFPQLLPPRMLRRLLRHMGGDDLVHARSTAVLRFGLLSHEVAEEEVGIEPDRSFKRRRQMWKSVGIGELWKPFRRPPIREGSQIWRRGDGYRHRRCARRLLDPADKSAELTAVHVLRCGTAEPHRWPRNTPANISETQSSVFSARDVANTFGQRRGAINLRLLDSAIVGCDVRSRA
jgi:hypothetical protein